MMLRTPWRWALVLALASGCGETESDESINSALSATDECQVQLSLGEVAVDEDEQTIRVSAIATNLTEERIVMTLEGPCSHLVSWSGVPRDEYDYYNQCRKGVCLYDLSDPPRTKELAPSAQEVLTTLLLQLDGGACNEALDGGTELSLSFTLPLGDGVNPRVCGPGVQLVTTPL